MITAGNTEMIERDLVFVGGGHSHALVLRMLAMKPIAGVRLTLVSDTLLTPYSGMLPGYLAGHYSVEETHLDLPRLCQAAQVRFIHARVTGIDLERKQLQLADQPPLSYDRVSINTGSTPNLAVPGAREFAIGGQADQSTDAPMARSARPTRAGHPTALGGHRRRSGRYRGGAGDRGTLCSRGAALRTVAGAVWHHALARVWSCRTARRGSGAKTLWHPLGD